MKIGRMVSYQMLLVLCLYLLVLTIPIHFALAVSVASTWEYLSKGFWADLSTHVTWARCGGELMPWKQDSTCD